MHKERERANQIIIKLESMGVPMDVREFSKDEYRKVFPQGTVQTPIGEVKIGQNQFSKMVKVRIFLFAKSGLIPRSSAPAVINQNFKMCGIKPDGIINFLSNEPPFGYNPTLQIPQSSALRRLIKSFKKDEKTSIIVSVVVNMADVKIAISTYKRKKREVIRKIKTAGVIVYEKDYGTSPTNRI